MVSLPVIVRHELVEGAEQPPLPKQDQTIETLRADRAHEPFRAGVRIRRLDRRQHNPHPGALDDAVDSLRPSAISASGASGRRSVHAHLPAHSRCDVADSGASSGHQPVHDTGSNLQRSTIPFGSRNSAGLSGSPRLPGRCPAADANRGPAVTDINEPHVRGRPSFRVWRFPRPIRSLGQGVLGRDHGCLTTSSIGSSSVGNRCSRMASTVRIPDGICPSGAVFVVEGRAA